MSEYSGYAFQKDVISYATNPGSAGSSQDRYPGILDKVRNEITKKHAAELADALGSTDAVPIIKHLIAQYLSEIGEIDDKKQNDYVDRIYQDMAGLGMLDKYLADPNVEEININGWNGIDVVYRTHTVQSDEVFPSASACIDVVKKMVRMGANRVIDGSNPRIDSFIGDGIRISAAIYPAVSHNVGAIASIRKQISSTFTDSDYINGGTATADMLAALSTFICNGVSICIAGDTSSGKTTDESYLIHEFMRNNKSDRIFTIEDSRELDLLEYDASERMTSRVLQVLTKGEPNPITQRDWVKASLRYDPKLIVPAEMRGEEAREAVEAGRTGHTIISSVHANSAYDAYYRILSMCYMSDSPLSEDLMLSLIVSAFPIMAFKYKYKDGSRKIKEIFEATGVENGKIQGTMLFRYFKTNEERGDSGKVEKTIGEFRRLSYISKALADRLYDNEAPVENIIALAGSAWTPPSPLEIGGNV